MNLNATLLVQLLCFAVFVWIMMRFVWPPITSVLEKRQADIADGLAAGEAGRKQLEDANIQATECIIAAKKEAAGLLDQANQRGQHLIDEAKNQALIEAARIKEAAMDDLEKARHHAKAVLLEEVSGVAVACAEKILRHHIDPSSNDRLITQFVEEM